MARCKNCGKTYSRWSAKGLGTGLCNECFASVEAKTKRRAEIEARQKAEAKRRAEIEARQKAEEEARIALPSLVKGLVPDKAFTVLGVAYWDTPRTAVGTAVAKLGFGGLFGGMGMTTAGKEHRAGVLAVSDTELFVVDLGMIVGEDVTLKVLKSPATAYYGPPSVKSAPLNALTATCRDMGNSAVLSIQGALKLKATFPNSYESGNASKAAQIARAIQAAHA